VTLFPSSEAKQRRVLVTGGAGFLGSNLCDRLIARGDSVICLDNLQTGRTANIAHLRDNPNFRFVEHDVIVPFHFDVDEIYNLACPASPPRYQRDPVHTMKTSVLGAINVLDLARSVGAKVFQASTSEVYGDPNVHPQPESYWGHVNSFGPRACYDEGKRCAETLFYDYHHQYGVEVRIARIFNTYGPRMSADDGRVVSNFIVQALKGEDITIFGDGTQTRSFCFADDLIDGFIRLMDGPSSISYPVNLGNPVEFTVAELADIVLDMTRSASRIDRRVLPVDDPRQRRPDISRAREVLNWEPRIELRQGLERTIAYFRNEVLEPAVNTAETIG
jgi:UDP-glucuronate decarboxylase